MSGDFYENEDEELVDTPPSSQDVGPYSSLRLPGRLQLGSSKARSPIRVANQKPETRESRPGTAVSAIATEWQCDTCTLLNTAESARCSVCDTPRPGGGHARHDPKPIDKSNSPSRKKQRNTDTWECLTCTLQNSSTATHCVACDTRNPKSKSSPSRPAHGVDSSDGENAIDEEDYGSEEDDGSEEDEDEEEEEEVWDARDTKASRLTNKGFRQEAPSASRSDAAAARGASNVGSSSAAGKNTSSRLSTMCDSDSDTDFDDHTFARKSSSSSAKPQQQKAKARTVAAQSSASSAGSSSRATSSSAATKGASTAGRSAAASGARGAVEDISSGEDSFESDSSAGASFRNQREHREVTPLPSFPEVCAHFWTVADLRRKSHCSINFSEYRLDVLPGSAQALKAEDRKRKRDAKWEKSRDKENEPGAGKGKGKGKGKAKAKGKRTFKKAWGGKKAKAH